MSDKTKEYSPSVTALLIGGKKASPAEDAAKSEKEDDEGDGGLTAIGKSLLAAIESKDPDAVGKALAEAHEYCAP